MELPLPWEVPHYTEPHHACPLGAGWWRAPAPRTGRCDPELRELGLLPGEELPDGSARYRFGPDLEPPNGRLSVGDPDEPQARAHWIATRLAAARGAWYRPSPEPAFMAVLNVTPDSFSDGGSYRDPEALADAAQTRRDEGAAWFDLGAESTRPGAEPVPDELQLSRLVPALEGLAGFGIPMSVDTRSAAVARVCLENGAKMINDVSALADPEMGPLIAEAGCEVVLMHMRGTSADMYAQADYDFLLGNVADELVVRVARALEAGVSPGRIILDPGIGFAKRAPDSLEMVGRLGALRALGFPVLVGPSRKSFLSAVLGERDPSDRDGGTAGAAAVCAAQGAAILRLHRGGEVWDAARTAWAATQAARGERPAGERRETRMDATPVSGSEGS